MIDTPLGTSRKLSARGTFWLIVLLGAMAGLGPLAIDTYLPAFPAIATQFGVSVGSVEITLATYFAGISVGQLFYGPFADRFGRKPPLYVGLLTFVIASVGCVFAPSVSVLAVLRFFQAIGGCAEMVIARAMVRDYFEARESARVFSFLMLVMGVAPIVAPLLGGALVVHFGWRSIFWMLCGFASLCLMNVAFFLQESHPPAKRHSATLQSAVKLYGRLLRDRTFLAYALSGSLLIAGMFAYIAGSPFVFIELFRVRPDRFGWFFGINAAGIILASQINGFLARRVDPHHTLRVAQTVAAMSGIVLFAMGRTHTGGFAGILIPLFIFVSCNGFSFPNSTALAMARHAKVAGSASAVVGFLQFLVSGIAGLSVSLLHDGTIFPMTFVMACAGSLALPVNLLAGHYRPIREK
jgi:DHA1 family bicyclomycin/chloramphenicol resistance-like MFS transporter